MIMLNRRHIRIKVLQALYAYFHSKEGNLQAGRKELLFSLDKVYELYILLLTFFQEISDIAAERIDQAKRKHVPNQSDLTPNTRFLDSTVLQSLVLSQELNTARENLKVNWGDQRDMVTKIYATIRETTEYKDFMASESIKVEDDVEFFVKIFKKCIANSEPLHYYFDEKSIYWSDDLDLVCSMVIKTLRQLAEKPGSPIELLPLYKNPEEEGPFAIDLYEQAILLDAETSAMIEDKTQNWELERIAMMDILIMKMAVAEVRTFPSIPTKVTLNEYIEISKFYSTPKSNTFINGILDNIFIDLKEGGKIKKVGRGLIE